MVTCARSPSTQVPEARAGFWAVDSVPGQSWPQSVGPVANSGFLHRLFTQLKHCDSLLTGVMVRLWWLAQGFEGFVSSAARLELGLPEGDYVTTHPGVGLSGGLERDRAGPVGGSRCRGSPGRVCLVAALLLSASGRHAGDSFALLAPVCS